MKIKSYKLFLATIAILLQLWISQNPNNLPKDHWAFSIPRNVTSLISYHGYTFEEHEVITSDGYILTLHQIPSNNTKSKQVPVLLGQCLSGSAAMWVYGYRSLAYKLADQGYDVWMINIRGNHYSRNHISMDTESREFWDFSFDESARLDYPAVVDYILEKTGFGKLNFVGYSMGTTQYLIFLSERPEYNDKIQVGYLLGPTAFFENTGIFFKPLTIKPVESMTFLLKLTGLNELMSKNYADWVYESCIQTEDKLYQCLKFWSVGNGFRNDFEIRQTEFFKMINQPGGVSVKTLLHYIQLSYGSGTKFQNFDYGSPEINVQKYGQIQPPSYNLSRISAQTELFAGFSDTISALQDVQTLVEILPKAKLHVVKDPEWNHYDFAYSTKVNEMVFDPIIRHMERFNN